MSYSFSFQVKDASEIAPVFRDGLQKILHHVGMTRLSSQMTIDLQTAFTEAVANAIKHAGEIVEIGSVEGRFFIDDRCIGFDVDDHGAGYDLNDVPEPDFLGDVSHGRGVFMMKQLGDKVTYRRTKLYNRLSFRREFVGSQNRKEINFLYELSDMAFRATHMNEIYDFVIQQIVDLFGVKRASILVFDETEKKLKIVASQGMDLDVAKEIAVSSGEGVSGFVFRHRRPLLIEDISTNEKGLKRREGYRSRSFISVPMIRSPQRSDEKPFGVINITERVRGKKFSRSDMHLLSTIANQTMACVYMRELVTSLNHNKKIRDDMEHVRSIQQRYLPKFMPNIKGYDIAGKCEMAESLGGDYFDVIRKDSQCYFMIADVSGHDVESALSMLQLRAHFMALLHILKSPAEITRHLNQLLCERDSEDIKFVSAIIGKIDLETHLITLSNAGHLMPLVSGHIFEMNQGLVLGISASESYEEHSFTLKQDENICFVTDGILEARSREGKFFGISHLKEFIAKAEDKTAQDFCDHLILETSKFCTDERRHDDKTVLFIKRVS